jgi:alkanesulfonate monooxygenase SsuD/methylene tetrahydromethanopterin reductase-like flavin-dependent oxidoreductase (luciferase family)
MHEHGRVRIGVKPGQWGWTWEELVASWQEAERSRFDLVSCFDHVSAAPAGMAAWNAPSLLVAMAGATRRVRLAVDVLNAALRHPFLLAGELAVAQAASGGRLQVGLGAGSFHLARFDHGALGIPFPPLAQRLDRLGRCCQVLPALWRGEEVSDAMLGLSRAALGPLGIAPPPTVVGGRSKRAMAVAARFADGWNAVVADAATFAALAREVDQVCAEVGRERPLEKQAQVFVRDVDLTQARALVEALGAAGAAAVTFVLVEERGPDAVRRLADIVL